MWSSAGEQSKFRLGRKLSLPIGGVNSRGVLEFGERLSMAEFARAWANPSGRRRGKLGVDGGGIGVGWGLEALGRV